MRAFIVIVLILAVGIGITGFALGWFASSPSPNEEKRDITLTVDPKELQREWDAMLGWFQSFTSPTGQKTDSTVMVEKMKNDRDEFQQQAGTRFKAMDLNLGELKAKAKHGRAVTKEQMNKAIADLNKKTEAAREELRALRTAPQERWDALKTRLNTSLEELKDGCDRVFSLFMTEWALDGNGQRSAVAIRIAAALEPFLAWRYLDHWQFDLDRDDLRHFDRSY